MLLNDLFEAGVDPRYLSAAERSKSQAQATQRQYWASPEEKAAARRTELKRDKGIAGYTKRHKAAHPEMYPKVTPRPAAKLRDPSTEYSDDYSVWAKGQRDTMEQGLAEGSEEQVYKVVALDKSNALKKPTKLNVKASSIEEVFSRLAANDWYALSINGVEVIAGKRLKQGVAEGPMPPRPTPKWSPEQAIKRQHSRRELARAQFLKKKAEQPPTAGMSAAEKVDKGWRNPNM